MNNSYYETLDENFTQALKLYEDNYTHDELMDLLKSGNIVQKQIAAIRLDGINNKKEAAILLDNLTGQDGKIREAVSKRVCEFMSCEMLEHFEQPEFYNIFLDAIIDINANICRNIICAITNLKSNSNFCKIFCSNLTTLAFNLLDIIEKFDFQDGKYKVNKEVFKLYWCLETIYDFYDKMNFEDLKEILKRSAKIQEYTIREKAAKILTNNFQNDELKKLKYDLQHDKNYYVRAIFERINTQL
ncbi:MAG: hypothetical protein ACI37Q_03880 [Candidatus Gastranaerophilaceae bacterium]